MVWGYIGVVAYTALLMLSYRGHIHKRIPNKKISLIVGSILVGAFSTALGVKLFGLNLYITSLVVMVSIGLAMIIKIPDTSKPRMLLP